jgi:hypothetical protein
MLTASPMLNLEIPALDPSKIIQPLPECSNRDWTSGSFSSLAISIPIRRTCFDGCARAASGHAATVPPTSVMNLRRRIPDPASDAINKNVGNFRHRSKRRMSELGQSRRSDRWPATSGLPPSADLFKVRRHVSKVPAAEIPGHFANTDFKR